MSSASSSRKREQYKVLCGSCPDPQCRAKLFFPAHDPSIECSGCGQRHTRANITDIAEVTNPQVALHNMLKNILLGNTIPKKGTDSVKVLGISNYQCKVISPLLTRYGMDKQTGEARLLEELGQGSMFDCGLLGDRAFLIEPEHIDIIGYGRDKTGSMNYLKDTLAVVRKYNGDVECLLPIHADGDGHCLVHAVSRALIGRELFWHALRENLAAHFKGNSEKYKMLFQDFIDANEWRDIIAECSPDFQPLDGEQLGLRNIHLFGLANVLRRPIVLLDSLSGLQSSGDYTGTFLPGLHEPSACRGKDGTLNKPLCVAWSGGAHNHYIALVGVKGSALPRLPGWMVPKAWGVPQSQMDRYIDKDAENAITLSGNKCLQERYILRLVQSMEAVFSREHGVSTALVSDVHQYVFKSTGIIGTLPETVIESAQKALSELRLYRCLTCDALVEWTIFPEQLRPRGSFYKLAKETHGFLSGDKHYSFPTHGLICSYDAKADILIPIMDKSNLALCRFCQGLQMRRVTADGEAQFENGDKTKTRTSESRCECGFKHYWDGKEYDNLPEIVPVSLEWNGQVVGEKVTWFQYESDPTMNSNVYEVANRLVQKHFPGEFGSERLAQKVVDTILRQTARKVTLSEVGATGSAPLGEDPLHQPIPTKIILTGQQSKSIHKEELVMSEAEKKVKANIEAKASQQQKRKTDELARQKSGVGKHSSTVVSKQQKIGSSPQPSTSKSAEAMDTSTPSTSKPDPKPGGKGENSKKIRVTTSDGRQLQLTLPPSGLTFSDLQQKLSVELGVAAERHKYRLGFPPKPLTGPPDGEEGKALAIQHGDRLMVEILPDLEALGERTVVVDNPWPAHEENRTSWSGFDASARETGAHEMLDSLQHLHDGSDSIDMSIATLVMMAKLQGKELWKYVSGMPHLFSVGGMFYQQVARDLVLTDGKHCTLPSIPGKVFRYSSANDRLELCLEPYGHYPIEPGVEARVLQSSLVNNAHQQGAFKPEILGTGASGVTANPNMKYPGHVAFSGQGHSLRSSSGDDDHMPKDLDPQPNHSGNHNQRHKATRFRTLSSGSIDESIPEEGQTAAPGTEVMDTGGSQFRRVGPGCTVLQGGGGGGSNGAGGGKSEAVGGESNSEILHKLTECLESFVEQIEEEELSSHLISSHGDMGQIEEEEDQEVCISSEMTEEEKELYGETDMPVDKSGSKTSSSGSDSKSEQKQTEKVPSHGNENKFTEQAVSENGMQQEVGDNAREQEKTENILQKNVVDNPMKAQVGDNVMQQDTSDNSRIQETVDKEIEKPAHMEEADNVGDNKVYDNKTNNPIPEQERTVEEGIQDMETT